MNIEVKGKNEENDEKLSLGMKESSAISVVNAKKEKKLIDSSEDFLNSSKNSETPLKNEIFTPAFWTNTEFQKITHVSWPEKYKIMKNQHFRCEVIEKRIVKKKIENAQHIIESPFLEKKMDDLGLNGREKNLLSGYNLREEPNVKPTFWPSRIYDGSLKELGEDASSFIEGQIMEFDKDVSIDDFEEPKQKGKKKKRKSNKDEKIRFCVEFSTLDYATEDDDDMTQWSDAEL